MKQMKVAVLMALVCQALAVPSDRMQVNQEVNSRGRVCRKHPIPRKKCCYEGSHGLKLWVTPAGSYDDVKQYCAAEGYDFLAITEEFLWQDVIEILRDQIGGRHDFWVDGSFNGMDWVYSDSTLMVQGAPFWDMEYDRPSHPDNGSCVALQGSRDYYWRNAPCHYRKHGLCVCCKVPPPPPPPPALTCPENATQIYDRCVKFLDYQVDEFQQAQDGCDQEGGTLLALNNMGILREFAQVVESIDSWSEIIFVDGELNDEGIFTFDNDEYVPMGSAYWQVGHPSGEANHLHFSTMTYAINDIPCTVGPILTTTPAPDHHNGPTGPFDVACQVPPV